MGKRLDCKDLRIECGYSACGLTAEEAVQRTGEHVQSVHAREGFSKEFYQEAIAAFCNQRCEQEMSLGESLCEACFGGVLVLA